MRKKIILLCVVLLFVPTFAMGDCLDVRRSTSWYIQGGHTLILYSGITPLAYVDIPYCILNPSSQIQLMKSYLCDGDKVLIDGDPCTILRVRSSTFFPY
jgi:hypothetical protein